MHQLGIDASPSQIRKLIKGHRVRVKKGTGFCLIVHPETFKIASRSFNKGKGAQLQLSQQEIMANNGSESNEDQYEDSELSGSGIFDNMVSHVKLADSLNHHLGTNYGYLKRAGLDNAIQSAKSAAMNKMGIDARMMQSPRIMGGQIERASIGRNGGMISSYTPPALVSQPFSANYQFQHFLPPQYQQFNYSHGMGFH